VRYTFVASSTTGMAEAVEAACEALAASGYSAEEVESSFQHDQPYNGLHLVVRSPGGQMVEVQFHTPESIAAKEASHHLYEIARDFSRPAADRGAADRALRELWEPVPKPTLPDTLIGMPVKPKTYPRQQPQP
jgi:hypothetical protein